MKITCPNCGKPLRAPKASAARKGRCPACGEVFQLPEAESTAAGPPPSNLSKCPFCGGLIQREAVVCKHCGRSFIEDTPEGEAFSYAGFWKRFAGALIDGVITGAALFAIEAAVPAEYILLDFSINLLFGLFYNAGFESSAGQATPGKMVTGIKVTDLYGRRVSFARAAGRHFAQYISIFTFGIGYIMIAFTVKKQGLHDIIAGCLVLND